MRDHFIARLLQRARHDPRILLVTGDLGFKVFDDYRAQLPRQFLNAGIAEQDMVSLATGMALEGRIVFAYSIANFATLRCLEQIRNDAAYHGADVKIVAVGGGFSYGVLGISHHATEDLAILRSLPEVTVVAPGDTWEAEEATEAMVDTPGTCYLRLDRTEARVPRPPTCRFEIGRARLVREGHDATLVSTGGILATVVQAAERLADEGIQVRVLSVHTLKPLDGATLEAAANETGAVVTVEEHTVHGGLGGAVAEHLLETGRAPRRFLRLGLPGEFSSMVGSQEYLRTHYRLDATGILESVRALLAR